MRLSSINEDDYDDLDTKDDFSDIDMPPEMRACRIGGVMLSICGEGDPTDVYAVVNGDLVQLCDLPYHSLISIAKDLPLHFGSDYYAEQLQVITNTPPLEYIQNKIDKLINLYTNDLHKKSDPEAARWIALYTKERNGLTPESALRKVVVTLDGMISTTIISSMEEMPE